MVHRTPTRIIALAASRLRLVIGLAAAIGSTKIASAAEIWLAGVDPFVRQVMQPGSPSDYLELFDDGAPWPRSGAAVKVFKTSTQYLLNAPDDALRRMFAGLRQRGIALAFEALMIPRTAGCGQNVEGYAAPGAIGAAAERTRRLGGVIEAVAMDEPLWFGHHYQGPRACQSSIEDVAHAVAENVAALRAVFPAARVGDIEPLDVAAPVEWAAEIIRFADAFAADTGTRLDFVDADIAWEQPWRPALSALAGRAHAAKITFGIIYNGDPQDDSDEAWTRHATERFETVETDPALIPNQAILQTWMLRPSHMLPETQPGTMTSLVLSYLRPATHLDIQLRDGAVTGRLTDDGGHPIAAAQITLTATDRGPAPRLTMRHIAGIVPPRAARALIGVRLDTECNCSGTATVRIGPIAYHSDGGPAVSVPLPPLVPGPAAAARPRGDVTSFAVAPGHPVSLNSGSFAVAASGKFDLDVPIGAVEHGGDVGYAALIFLDAAGQEMRRLTVGFTPSVLPIAEPLTNELGVFSLPVTAATGAWAGEWRATYAGNDRWRGSAATASATLAAPTLAGPPLAEH